MVTSPICFVSFHEGNDETISLCPTQLFLLHAMGMPIYQLEQQ